MIYGILPLLTVAFVVLKITDQINWSWWVVLSPMWGSFIVVGLLVALLAAIDPVFRARFLK